MHEPSSNGDRHVPSPATRHLAKLGMGALGISLVIAAVAVGHLPGLSLAGTRALSLLGFALCWWIGRPVDEPVTAILALALIPVLGIENADSTLAVFGSSSIWTVMALLMISRAVARSGLGDRAADLLMKHLSPRPALLLLEYVFAMHALVFLLPSGPARTAIVLPATQRLNSRPGLSETPGFARASMLAAGLVPLISSIGVLTGAPSTIYAAAFFKSSLNVDLTYATWLAAFTPVAFALSAALWLVLLLTYKIRLQPLDSLAIPAKSPTPAANGLQWRAGAVLLLLVLGWLLGPQVSLPLAVASLLGVVLLVLPGVGVLRWADAVRAVDLNLLLLFAGGLGLAGALTTSGAAQWIAGWLIRALGSVGPNAVIVFLGVVAFSAVLRLAITTNVGNLAIVLPIALAAARVTGLNPLWVGMAAVLPSWMGIVLPYQSTSVLMTYGTGTYGRYDLVKVALLLVPLAVAIMAAGALVLWPALGIRP